MSNDLEDFVFRLLIVITIIYPLEMLGDSLLTIIEVIHFYGLVGVSTVVSYLYGKYVLRSELTTYGD